MKIAVFVKHVPDTSEADLAVAADGLSIKEAGLPFQMNEWDRFALEEAVRLKDASGGTLTAYLLGPEEHEESLRRCLAVGADRAVRVWDEAFKGGGPALAAAVLHKALKGATYDLCLFGAQASDDGYGMVGPALAEGLGFPCVTLVNGLTLLDGRLKVIRELEGGFGEAVEVTLPAVVTIQTGINEPRYVSILGIKKARAKPIDLEDAGTLGLDLSLLSGCVGKLTLEELLTPAEGKQAELWGGSMEEIASRFVAAVGGAK